MALSGDEMDVTISLAGLTHDQAHMQHIHGAHGTLATCPTPASANADGIITLATGTLPAYRPVALPFEPTPTADASGKITWSRTLRLLPDDIYNIKTLTDHVVLIHGMTLQRRLRPDAARGVRTHQGSVAPQTTIRLFITTKARQRMSRADTSCAIPCSTVVSSSS